MRLSDIPLTVILTAIGALMMLLPATHALAVDNVPIARVFLQSSVLCLAIVTIVGLAAAGSPAGPRARDSLLAMVYVFTLLPAVLALPFYEVVGDTSYLNAWWEMLSSLTTTGATLYAPERLPESLHLWRAQLGWLGGFFMLASAVAVLAPLRIGGFELFHIIEGNQSGISAIGRDYALEARERLLRAGLEIAPIYIGMTAALWLMLQIAGDAPVHALIHAMSTISTSGISGLPSGVAGAPSGYAGEALVFLFLPLALSRKFWPAGGAGFGGVWSRGFSAALGRGVRGSGGPQAGRPEGLSGLGHDPELRLAAMLVLFVPLVMLGRHLVSALELGSSVDLPRIFTTLWGGLFTVLSFLTTTGFESAGWQGARAWSGLGNSGLTLAGLAIIGGGVATTAGGVRLLRCYALMRHGEREIERIVHPTSIGTGGAQARRLRGEGAFIAWIFFMLFALSVAVVMTLCAMAGLGFEPAMVFSIASLANCGPLAGLAADAPLLWADLGGPAKAVLALAMVVGRLETLAFIALLNPELWRS